MLIASHILAYNVSSTLRAALENMAPHVDKIFIAYPSRPWNYVPHSRQSKTNPTSLAEVHQAAAGLKVEILEGDWSTDEESRNACLERAKGEGFDWFLTQDADEFYTESGWAMIREKLLRSTHEEYFVTTWYNFWKSAQFVVVNAAGDLKDTNAGFALRCKDHLRFVRSRQPNSGRRLVMDCPCYHYGYVRTDAEISEKIETWTHAKDFDAERWYRLKWLGWTERTINLHPIAPWTWKRAIRFPLEQPPFSLQFNLDYTSGARRTLGALIGNAAFDVSVSCLQRAREVRSLFKVAIGR